MVSTTFNREQYIAPVTLFLIFHSLLIEKIITYSVYGFHGWDEDQIKNREPTE